MLTEEVCTKLESLIVFSGLFFRVEVSPELSILFKTVTYKEERVLELQTSLSLARIAEISSGKQLEHLGEIDKVRRYAAMYLARSVVFINDQNMLNDRVSSISLLESYFKTLPFEVLSYLFSEALKRRSEEMGYVKYLEDFHRLMFSKWIWRTLKECGFNSFKVTGLMGSDNLCLSYIQLLFMGYMEASDEMDKNRNMFKPFQFISGLFSKDAPKKIDEYFDRIELSRLKKYKRDLYVQGVTTQEELVSQLDRMMQGHEDDADKVIKRSERHDYEKWKCDYLDSRKKVEDSGIPILGERHEEMTEEFLVKEYLKHKNFRFSSWLLDELRNEKQNG
jgi:hypothetical protein